MRQFSVLAAGVTPAAVGFTNAKLTLSAVGQALTCKTPGLTPGLALKEKFTVSVASTPGAGTVTVAPAAPAAMSAVVMEAVPLAISRLPCPMVVMIFVIYESLLLFRNYS